MSTKSKSTKSLRTTQKASLTELEVVAVHQLIQISDEENNNSIDMMKRQNDNNNLGHDDQEEAEPDRTSLCGITSKKIEGIFGEEEEAVIVGRKRKKKYRSLESIYRESTRPTPQC